MNGTFNGQYYENGRIANLPININPRIPLTDAQIAARFENASNITDYVGVGLGGLQESSLLTRGAGFVRGANVATNVIGTGLTYGNLRYQNYSRTASAAGALANTGTTAAGSAFGTGIGVVTAGVVCEFVTVGACTPVIVVVGGVAGGVAAVSTGASGAVGETVASTVDNPPPARPTPRSFRVPTCSIFDRSPICFPNPFNPEPRP